MTRAVEALREAERFMAYFAGETGGSFVGPGTPQSCLAQIRSALTCDDAQAAPEGWKLVPTIPNQAMIEAGCDNNPTSWNEGTDDGFAADVANDVYVAMVRAAPSSVPSTDRETVSPASYCALCDLEHPLHEDAQGFHHVIKGERVACPVTSTHGKSL